MDENELKLIHESLDNIEPAEGAKERILKNIMTKVQEQEAIEIEDKIEEKETAATEDIKKEKSNAAKIISIGKWLVPLAACLVLVFVGLKFNIRQEPGEGDVSSSIFDHVDSIEELNQRLGLNLVLPEELKEPRYSIMYDTVAYIDFMYNEKVVALYLSKDSKDYSSTEGEIIQSQNIDSVNNAILEEINGFDARYFKVKWTVGEVYYLLESISEITSEEMISLYQIILQNQ